LDARLAEVVHQWNERYEYPKLILSRNAEFYEYIEKNYGAKLPVYRGSAGAYWEDGAASSARETTLCRNAEQRLASAAAMAALADRIAPAGKYPALAIDAAWRNCLLYDEHTWGAHCSISQPDSDFTLAQWKIKAQYAVDAAGQSQQIQRAAVQALAVQIRTDGPALFVFNPASWPRTDLVRVDMPQGMTVADPEVPVQATPDGTYVFVSDVPPCGYRVLKLAPRSGGDDLQMAPGNVIESRYYRVEFDPASGAIVSIRDKELGRELVDRKAPYQLNQYLYVAGGNNRTRIVMNPHNPPPALTITVAGHASLQRKRKPGVAEAMFVQSSGTMAPRIATMVHVWEKIKRIDIVNRFDKTQTYDKEAVYFAFPFAAQEPTFRYEVPAGIVDANHDMLPGACRDWFAVQDFVEVAARDAAVVWATPDAPLACFQDINRGRWLTELPMTNGHVYSYAMNNYWHTNYKAGQGGTHEFRFAITSRTRADSAASARFGFEVARPLIGLAVSSNSQGRLAAESTSLIAVAEPNVLLTGVKRSDDGQSLVVRLWELSGRATVAHLRLAPGLRATKAATCNLVEDPGDALSIHDGQLAVPVRGAGLATVRIE
jgi:alpha-mannosidase